MKIYLVSTSYNLDQNLQSSNMSTISSFQKLPFNELIHKETMIIYMKLGVCRPPQYANDTIISPAEHQHIIGQLDQYIANMPRKMSSNTTKLP